MSPDLPTDSGVFRDVATLPLPITMVSDFRLFATWSREMVPWLETVPVFRKHSVMRHRRVLQCFCLIGAAFACESPAQTLGRQPAPAARLHDMSYGTWTDLPDAWGYFPPSSIAERQQMLAWADRIRRDAAVLERSLVVRDRAGQRSTEIEAVRAVRFEAETLRQDLLFGSHMADFRSRLVSLATALDAAAIRDSANAQVRGWVEKGGRDFEKIVNTSGPWPREPLVSSPNRFAVRASVSGEDRVAVSGEEDRSASRP